jgi:NhaP-type Na+/H+ and K+/H+ antiporter
MQRAALHHLVVTLAQLGVVLVNHLLAAPSASRKAVAVAVVIMVILIFLVRLEEEDLQALELILKAAT